MEPEQNNELKKPWYKYKRTKADSVLGALGKFFRASILIIAALIIIINQFSVYLDEVLISEEPSAVIDESVSDKKCNVIGLELHGDLVTYISPGSYDGDGRATVDQTASQDLVYKINEAEKDNSIKAILMEVDSYGGSPVAGEEVNTALKNAKKPTVVIIRESGDSAAYYSAVGADIIFASKNSDVGSIGVTMSYSDVSRQNQRNGLIYNQLSSGKFKDAGNPDKPLTPEEVKLFMRDVNILHQNFVKVVSEDRKLSMEKVASLADGSAMLGEMALQNGLIDKIGGMPEVKQYLKDKIGADPEICW